VALEQITDPEIIAGYLVDASNTRGHAEVLVRPRSTEEVSAVLAHCQSQRIPVTVTAQRTSTTGGPVPQGGWLLSTEFLAEISHLGHDIATAQAGVFLGAFQNEIESSGRFFPPDPTSRHECTLGAAIACNASGACSFLYGPTRPWVEALVVVLPSGEVRHLTRDSPLPPDWPRVDWHPPQVKSAAGYAPGDNLLDLFIGQEGTLGIITEATVRLTDLPAQVISLLAFFPTAEAGIQFVHRARASARNHGPVSPRCLEWYDHNALAMVRTREPGIPVEARAAVWCEQESADDSVLAAWLEILESAGALVDQTLFAQDAPERARLAHMRHAVPAGVNERVVANGMPKVGTDCAVPDAALDEIMAFYAQAPLDHVLFGHVGDNHLHLNLLPTSQEELETAHRYYRDVCRLAVSLGGTISAEHGIGKLKRAHLADMVGPEVLAQFSALKQHLDPAWILGRGNLLAPPPELGDSNTQGVS
jgi:FAD/FMN-containing dehydrogenase